MFVTKILVTYNFEQNNLYKVEVYDIDDENNINNTAKQEKLGVYEFTLHEVVTSMD